MSKQILAVKLAKELMGTKYRVVIKVRNARENACMQGEEKINLTQFE